MRNEAVEEDHVTGRSRHRLQFEPALIQWAPFLADEALPIAAGRDLQTAVVQGRRIERHHGADEDRRIATPAGLLVLMRLEAPASRHLEIDLVLEEHYRTAHQRTDPTRQRTVANQPFKTCMEGREIFDPLNDPPPGLGQAVLAINPMSAGLLRRGLQFR